MQNFEGKDQCDQGTKTRGACHEVELMLVEFWLDQLNRVKEYVESQPIKSGSRGD